MFSVADLRNTTLVRANLGKSILNDANLSHSKCDFANLRAAILYGANFTGTSLRGVTLSKTRLGGTLFGDVDLSEVVGLDACEHLTPSIIDHQTLTRSGRLPLKFLRGCGLPDTLIEYMPTLLKDPIQIYSCFISYSSKDQKFTDRLYSDLQNKGVRCWLASEDLKAGEKIRPSIDEAIRLHDKLLLVLSKHSVASEWVEQEVETALERERREKRLVLFPIRLDDAVMDVEGGWSQFIRNTRNISDFRRWKSHDSYQKAFDRLLRDLRAEEKRSHSPPQ
jgi:hypothetical protein